MGEIFSFGEWVRRRRKALDLTQDALARQVGCALSMVRKIESDERRPSRQIAELLADALAVPPAERDQFLRTARAELAPDRLAPPAGATQGIASLPRHGNLPAQLPTLLGRAQDLETLAALLAAPDLRLLTLIGPGGIGKTSLALGVAAQLADRYADGVWFVDLAPVSDPARVAPAILQALGLPEGSQHAPEAREIWARLARWLAARQALLVLDNLEQVTECAPQIAALLHAAPALQILVTSRVALRLRGEREYPLAPLPTPHQSAAPDQIADSPAVQLFVARAQAVRPSFTLSPQNAAAISGICATLDGLPLAIELAAARVRMFSPQDLLPRLQRDGGLALLSAGARDLPARQQTIRATIAWSYALLSPAEQLLLARLGVFIGSWTLDLAERALASVDGNSLLDALQTLVEHSLVHQSETDTGDRTFRLLEAVRAFAGEQLAERREVLALRDQHLAACVAFAEEAEPQLRSAAQIAWLPRIDAIYDNLRAALVWGLDDGPDDPARHTLGLRLAGALWYYWYIRGRFQEIFRWLDHPAADDERLPVALRAHVLLSHWFIVSDTGSQTDPFTTGIRGLTMALQTDDSRLRAQGLLLSESTDDWATSNELAAQVTDSWWRAWFAFKSTLVAVVSNTSRDRQLAVLSAVRQAGDGLLISRALAFMSHPHLVSRNFLEAQRLCDEELATARQLNFLFGVASALFSFIRIADAQGDVQRARMVNEERYSTERLLDNPHGYIHALLDSIRLAIWQADYRSANALLGQIERRVIRAWPTLESTEDWVSAWLALEQSRVADALAHLQQAQLRSNYAGVDHAVTRSFLIENAIVTCSMLGGASSSHSQMDAAVDAYTQALHIYRSLTAGEEYLAQEWLQIIGFGFTGPAIVALSGLGRIAAYHPDRAWARAWLAEMLDALRTHAGIWETTIARAVWGRAYLGWGEYPAAAAQLSDDLRFYQKAGARRAAAEALECLGMCGAAQGQHGRAARVWGAAAATRAQIGAPIWPADIPIYDQHVAAARASLGDAAFDAAFDAGQALTLDLAVAEALALSDRNDLCRPQRQ